MSLAGSATSALDTQGEAGNRFAIDLRGPLLTERHSAGAGLRAGWAPMSRNIRLVNAPTRG